MALYLRGDIYWYEFVKNGQRIRESTGETTRTKALQKERERHNELDGSGRAERLDKLRRKLFPAAAKDWFESNKAGWSESYQSMQILNIEHLTVYFGKRLLLDIGPDDIGKYQAKQRSKSEDEKWFRYGKGKDKHGSPLPVSTRTINMEIATIRMILKWGRLWKGIEDYVKMLPERKKVGRALTVDEVKKLLDSCRKSPQPSLFTAVIIFCNTALRSGELRRAHWSQVDFLKAEFTVGQAKTDGSTGRVVPLNTSALEAFRMWKESWPNAEPDDFVFPSQKLKYVGKGSGQARGKMVPYGTDMTKPLGSWKKSWASVQKEAGVTARIHDLRHHANTVMVESGTPIPTLKSITGHLTDEMVEHYTHIRDEAKRRAVDALNATNTGVVQ
jgi:integrase